MKKKVVTRYDQKDIADLITDFFLSIQSPDGVKFEALHYPKGIVSIRVNKDTYIINITNKDELN